MKRDFDRCLEMLLHLEGGFTADRFDPGNDGDGYGNQGSTNLGAMAKVYAAFTGQPAPIVERIDFDCVINLMLAIISLAAPYGQLYEAISACAIRMYPTLVIAMFIRLHKM